MPIRTIRLAVEVGALEQVWLAAAEVSDAQQPDLEMSIAPAVIEAMHRSLSRLIADEPAASPEVKSQAEVQPTTKRG